MKKSLLFLLLLYTSYLSGQPVLLELISASGGDYVSSKFRIDWSIGECFIDFSATANSDNSSGFQQGAKRKIQLTSFTEHINSDVVFSISSDTYEGINISTSINDETQLKNYTLIVSDIVGRQLLKQVLIDKTTNMNLDNYSKGIYLFTISDGIKFSKTFKTYKLK